MRHWLSWMRFRCVSIRFGSLKTNGTGLGPCVMLRVTAVPPFIGVRWMDAIFGALTAMGLGIGSLGILTVVGTLGGLGRAMVEFMVCVTPP